MIRKALLIACTDTHSGHLDGPVLDVRNISNFLRDKIGGCWYKEEINTLINPTINQLKDSINDMSDAEYTFVSFSGHGGFETKNRTQLLEVMDGVVDLQILVTSAKRQLMLIDACRSTIGQAPAAPSRLLLESFGAGGKIIGPAQVRDFYEKQLESTEEGVTILYACSLGEAAADSDRGGAYTVSLLDSAYIWDFTANRNSVLDVKESHLLASKYIKTFVTTQKPVIRPERRASYYPFAVKL